MVLVLLRVSARSGELAYKSRAGGGEGEEEDRREEQRRGRVSAG